MALARYYGMAGYRCELLDQVEHCTQRNGRGKRVAAQGAGTRKVSDARM